MYKHTGKPFELGLGTICFAMTLVLTIPIYGTPASDESVTVDQ